MKDDSLIVVGLEMFAPEIVRTLPQAKIVGYPHLEPIKWVPWQTIYAALDDQESMQSLLKVMSGQLDAGGDIFLVTSDFPTQENPVEQLPHPPFEILELKRERFLDKWLREHAKPVGEQTVFDAQNLPVRLARFIRAGDKI